MQLLSGDLSDWLRRIDKSTRPCRSLLMKSVNHSASSVRTESPMHIHEKIERGSELGLALTTSESTDETCMLQCRYAEQNIQTHVLSLTNKLHD